MDGESAPTLSPPSDAELLAHVEQFLSESGMKPTRFGIEAMREGGLVASLRAGRSLSLRNASRIATFIDEWRAANASAKAHRDEAVHLAPRKLTTAASSDDGQEAA